MRILIAEDDPVSRRLRILLAEDNAVNQKIASSMLTKRGHTVVVAENGKEVLADLEAQGGHEFDLILMDVQMPEMDGLEATCQIRDPRSAVPNHGIPIIAMTAHAMQGDRERCLEAGMNDYVTKPINPRALVEALDKLLPKKMDETKNENTDGGETSSVIPHHAALVFDLAGMMDRLMNDEELVKKVTEAFLEDMPRQIAALKGCLETGDATGAGRRAHSIVGAAANVGGEALSRVALEIETAGKVGDMDLVKARMADIDAQFNRLKKALTANL